MRLFRKCPKCDRHCGKDKDTRQILELCPVCDVSLRNQNWFIDYYFNGERKREVVGTNKRLAEEVVAKRQTQIKEGRFFDIKKEKTHSLFSFSRFKAYSGVLPCYVGNRLGYGKGNFRPSNDQYDAKIRPSFPCP